jgi:hypothetical protein
MGTRRVAEKLVCVLSLLVLMLQPAVTQQKENDSRLDRLFGSDPAARGSAKTELLVHPDPALLPALLNALLSSKGSNHDGIIEILNKYDGPRKIPVFLEFPEAGSGGRHRQWGRRR